MAVGCLGAPGKEVGNEVGSLILVASPGKGGTLTVVSHLSMVGECVCECLYHHRYADYNLHGCLEDTEGWRST